jgi:hypothetical protein
MKHQQQQASDNRWLEEAKERKEQNGIFMLEKSK